jgi:hypothetical protein
MELVIKKRIKESGKYSYKNTIIYNDNELLEWINENIGDHKYVNINNNISEYVKGLIKNNITVSHKEFLRNVKRISGSTRTMNSIKFWLARGYSEDEAKEKVHKFQKMAGDTFSRKRKLDPNKYKDYTPSQIGYWLKKGYDEKEAKLLVSERQHTFSLDLCIEKYGKIKGTEIFKKRQHKWFMSRQRSLNDGLWDWDSCGKSFKRWEDEYGPDWVIDFIDYIVDRNTTKNSHLYKIIKENFKNLESYLMTLPISDFKPLSIIGLVNYITKKSHIELKELWCKTNNVTFIKTRFGNVSYSNGKFYQSEGEYQIGKYLELLGVDFIVHKQYENTSYLCDFYLPKLDMYIEYMGMNGKSYDEKRKSLTSLNFKIIWSSDINFIKNKINEKIYRN